MNLQNLNFRTYLFGILLAFVTLSPTQITWGQHPVPEEEEVIAPGDHQSDEAVSIAYTEEEHADHEEGHHTDFSPLLFIILALIIGAATRFFLSKIGLPFTVALLIIGLGIGVLGRNEFFDTVNFFGSTLDISVLDRAIDWAAHLDAHLILYVFLPILIFEAAFAMDVHTFKKSFTNSVLLAVPGIIIAIICTAAGVWVLVDTGIGLDGWEMQMIVLFGTVISATDPVAVVAILKELGASKKLGTLIEGESLLNDGTAIVIFMVIFMGMTGAATDTSPLWEFFRVSFGGVAIGFIIGKLGLGWIKNVFNDMLIEITLIVALAYLTFFLCEDIFHVSGVLGLVTLGLLMSGPGRTKISPEVQHFIHEFWEFCAFTANTLIFLIVGVVIAERTVFDTSDVIVLLLVYIIIHLARIVVIAVLYPFMKRAGYGIGKNHPQAMWWGALRGAIGLALALIVESSEAIPLAIREEFLFLTAGIVTLTLLINATTMKAVAKMLGLTKMSKSKQYVIETANEYLHTSTHNMTHRLREDRFFKKVDWEFVENYLPKEAHAPTLDDKGSFAEESRRRLLEKEKSSYWHQFKEGLISSEAYALLTSEINEIIDAGADRSLADRYDLDELLSTKNAMKKWNQWPVIKWFTKGVYINKLATSFDAAKGFHTAQEECKHLLESMGRTATDEEIAILSEMEKEVEENKIQALTFLRNFGKEHPEIYTHVSTKQAIRTVLNFEKKTVNRLLKNGRITNDEAVVMVADIEHRMKKLKKDNLD